VEDRIRRRSALDAHRLLSLVLAHADPSPALAFAARDLLDMLALVLELDAPRKAGELARSANRVACLIAYEAMLRWPPRPPPGNAGSGSAPISEVRALLTGTKH
jgi:hypothetical protein